MEDVVRFVRVNVDLEQIGAADYDERIATRAKSGAHSVRIGKLGAAHQRFRAEPEPLIRGSELRLRRRGRHIAEDGNGFQRDKRIPVHIRDDSLEQVHESLGPGIDDSGSSQNRQQVRRAVQRGASARQQDLE